MCGESTCEYEDWAPSVKKSAMFLESCKLRVTRKNFYHTMNKVVDLVQEGSVVAVEAGDQGEDYYLLRANGSSEKITEETIIGGENVLPNAIVVRGNWFIESKKGSRMYRLDSKKEVVISSNSVRFILPSLEIVKEGRKVLFSISEEQHEDIIESLL